MERLFWLNHILYQIRKQCKVILLNDISVRKNLLKMFFVIQKSSLALIIKILKILYWKMFKKATSVS